MIFIPFNHQPFSVSVKTVSYTIPAGFYARAVVEADNGGIFTIDTVNAMETAALVNVDSYQLANNVNLSYTVPSGYRSEVYFNAGASGPTDAVINGNTSTSVSYGTGMVEVKLGPGGVVSLAANSTGARSIVGQSIPAKSTYAKDTFWLPTGTVINGTGNWKAVVELYPMIS